MDEKIGEYIVKIVFATRKPSDFGLPIDRFIEFGASQDVKSIAMDVLRHRIIVTYEAENVTSESIVTKILNSVPVP